METPEVDGLFFRYDPEPASNTPPEAGVQRGWLVIWDGKPGPAMRQDAALLHDGEGGASWVPVGEFVECEVVDDR